MNPEVLGNILSPAKINNARIIYNAVTPYEHIVWICGTGYYFAEKEIFENVEFIKFTNKKTCIV